MRIDLSKICKVKTIKNEPTSQPRLIFGIKKSSADITITIAIEPRPFHWYAGEEEIKSLANKSDMATPIIAGL